ncbi:MAG: hypothetical protein M9939_00870 [Mesorhizobium sp.]|nr:hypothetical protein [Mesorhizobium sp.]MCO5159660.1 hypothetical protein [Mesorhizobium sp.]
MSDATFPTPAFPGYTTGELRFMLAGLAGGYLEKQKLEAEIERREKVASGDETAMTPGEKKLHHSRRLA